MNLTIAYLFTFLPIFFIPSITQSKIVFIILTIIVIAANIAMLIIGFTPRSIVLEEDGIKINGYIFWGVKYMAYINISYKRKIPYCDITDIEWLVDFCDVYNKYYRKLALLTSLGCDYDNTLLIRTTKHNYIFSVKNSEDFYDRIMQSVDRIKFLKELKIDDLIVSHNQEYGDLKFRWKSSNELDSVYYIDNSGNEITIAQFEYDQNGIRHISNI
ncbi:MAG: hypothetical protein J1E36_00030 [Eubacterium sp.]|nr:hypothetical protein [Eubacterium sp.]